MGFEFDPPDMHKVHIATTLDEAPYSRFEDLVPLCGEDLVPEMEGDEHEMVVTLPSLDDAPLGEDEYVCSLCMHHPDYPLLVLANVGEEF